MTRVVIDRSRWGRQALLNSKNKMCCLGFCAKSAGATDEDMRNKAFPYNLTNWQPVAAKFPGLFNEGGSFRSFAANNLAEANDGMINGPEKEEEIKKLGVSAGIQFVFTGEYK